MAELAPARRGTDWRLWFGVFAAPLAWTAHLLLSYFLVPTACATLGVALLHAVTLVTAAVALAGAVVALRAWQQLAAEAARAEPPPARGQRFLALFGFLLSAIFLFVTLVEGLPPFFMSPCGP